MENGTSGRMARSIWGHLTVSLLRMSRLAATFISIIQDIQIRKKHSAIAPTG